MPGGMAGHTLESVDNTMLWFKHSHDLRNSPAMRQIQRKLGDEGFAAAIRLIEVLTYRCGTGSRFNPILKLAPPTSEIWLATEILTYDVDDDSNPLDHLNHFLNEFAFAGLINTGQVAGTVTFWEDGAWVTANVKHTTITLVEFEEMMDTWTSRVKDGKPGANSTKV